MKRSIEETKKVYGRASYVQHPVLAPAPQQQQQQQQQPSQVATITSTFDQENIALSMGQFQSTSQNLQPQSYQVPGPATGAGQSHTPLPTHPQAHINPTTQPHMSGSGNQGQQFQRLKVEDALSYLDQVKMQFGNQPQVYNDFLDIMKEFKSQSIDTPGVISRVSNLFKGHPDLIVGFNTFLPPGYKIEVHPNDANSISYTTPILQKTNLGGQSVHTISLTGATHTSHVSPHYPHHAHQQPSPAQPGATQQPSTIQQQPVSHHAHQPVAPPNITIATQPPLQQQQQPASQPTQTKLGNQGNGHVVTQQQHSQQRNVHSPPPSNQNQPQQPVEFNHAINYVNKIKNRFQGQPDTYKAFLEILHSYQKEQKNIKEAASMSGAVERDSPQITEQEMYVREAKLANDVYQRVAKLFKNQEDLLHEFSQFLPDANGTQSSLSLSVLSKRAHTQMANMSSSYGPPSKKQALASNTTKRGLSQGRRNSNSAHQTSKVKQRNNGIKEFLKHESTNFGSVAEYAFFDKVRKALRSQKVYEDFLRCLKLFNEDVISRSDLIQLVSSFLGKFPELFKWFKEFLGYKDSSPHETPGFKERTSGELAHLEIDYSTCKRMGTSYRALPKSYTQPKCTGRTPLCREVLNDTWVSFPCWSEDTTFLGTKKTQYEEYIFRCEDERFELDGILETNLSTIRVLEAVQKKLNHMTTEDQQKFRLDNCLGGTSEVIHKRAIQRIYGDKAADIVDGLKKTPAVAVPLVLKRLKAKEEEWRAAQRLYNKVWRDQNEKYYLKSLDYQSITFKTNDLKTMRSKSLVTEIENIYDEKQAQAAEGNGDVSGPHLIFTYKDKSILDDAASLIVHHMKRQTNIQKEDKARIKNLLHTFVADLFFAPRGELSDDEESMKDGSVSGNGKAEMSNGLPEVESDDAYNLFFVNNLWYSFLRLHQMVCERLLKMYQRSVEIAEGEASDKKQRKEATAVALRLKAPTEIDVEEYYPAFLDMVRNLLDCSMEPSSFEDTCREMFGVHAYITFTIDKLIQNIVRLLEKIVCDETSYQVKEIYQQEQGREGAGGNSETQALRQEAESLYQKKAETLLNDENCYKFVIHKDRDVCRMSIELIESEDFNSENPLVNDKWNDYVEKYVASEEVPMEVKERLKIKPIFLPRTSKYIRSRSNVSRSQREGDEGNSSPRDVDSDDLSNNIVIEDYMECKISSNSYKMTFVEGGRSFFYRRKSLPKARENYLQVARKLRDNFRGWLDTWIMANVSRDQKHTCAEWLAGNVDGLRECTTTKVPVRDGHKCYTKYTVDWPPTAPPMPAADPAAEV